MPLRGPGGGGGGGGLIFRRPANIFTGANLGACRTARDAYFVAPATAGALSEYQGNEFLAIVLNPASSTANVFETYLPGNAGATYASAQWVARTSAIQGNPGPKGNAGTAVDATARSAAEAAALAAASAKSEADANAVDAAAEAVTRADADTALGLRIDAVPPVSPGSGADPTARRLITAETTNRKTADTALGTRITGEATLRGDADLAEARVRTAAVTSLNTRVADEAAARIAGDALITGFHEFTPGPTPNIFSGANRAAAVAALDKYLDGVSVTTQASVRVYADANNYITVSINAAVALGPRSNKWIMKWGGNSDGSLSVETFDNISQAIVEWDVGATTLNGLHELFQGDSKFSSVVTGDDTAIASVIETFGEDVVGNTIFFGGGTRVHVATPHSWFAHYVDNLAATVTLEYQSRQELQTWDAALIDFRTAFTLLDSPARPHPFTVLTHPSDIPTEDWQWTLGVELGEEQLIGRAGGTVLAPTTKDIRPLVPVESTEVHFRFIDHTSTYRDQVYIAALILPSGEKVAGMNASFALGDDLFHLRISDVGAVYLKRATVGTTTVLCDIWYR